MNNYLHYSIFILFLSFNSFKQYDFDYNQWYSNIPTYDSYILSYGDYTWRNSSTAHVSIFNLNSFCCATLLTLQHALTAASCFEPDLRDIKKMLAVAGATHLREHDPRAQVREIKQFVTHEGYVHTKLDSDDIGIIIMSSPFVETFRLKPALLPTKYYMNINKLEAYVTIYFRLQDHDGYYGKVNVDGFRLKGDDSYKCRYCDAKYRGTDKQFDDKGFMVGRFTCLYPKGNRYEGDFQHSCFDSAGCPVLTFDRHLVLMETYFYHKVCTLMAGGMPQVGNACGIDLGESLEIQVFHYVKWIKSKLITKKVIRFRPYKIPTKKINITPHIPLVVYIILLAIAFIVFLICNRAVFGRIRF